MFKIYLALPMYHEAGQKLLAENAELKIGNDADPDVILKNIKDADALIVRMPVYVTKKILYNKNKLKVIASAGAGVDNIDLKSATKRKIIVTFVPGLGGDAVSEHTLALMLNLSRNILYFDNLVRNKRYDERLNIKSHCLEGKTVGIIGFGTIGSMVARKCKFGFNMEVIVYDPFVEIEGKAGFRQIRELKELLTLSDFVSLHLPLTKKTRYMFQYEHFKIMKRSAYFINTSRGGLVKQSDLIQALQEKIIAGAGIDVFDPEPPTSDEPLFSLDNVILTPHVGGAEEETLKKMSVICANEVLSILNGNRPRFIANPEVLN